MFHKWSLVTVMLLETFILIKKSYFRLRNKHRGMLINFGTFFQGLCSLLERVMHIFFSKYLLFDGMGDAYSQFQDLAFDNTLFDLSVSGNEMNNLLLNSYKSCNLYRLSYHKLYSQIHLGSFFKESYFPSYSCWKPVSENAVWNRVIMYG